MDFNPANAVPEDYKPQASFNPANAIPDSGDAMPAPVATGIPKPKEDKKSYEDKSATYYGNLDGVPERLDPDKRAALDTLINAAPPDQKKEYVARSVNQWFVGSQMPDTEPQWIADNWENAKRGFVKTRMGLDIDKISDETMYDMIGRRLKDGRIDPKEPFTWHVPLTVFPVPDAEKAAHETFWESLNVGAIQPKTYDLSKIPDMNVSEIPFSNPRIAAAVWNGTAVPLINSLTSPLGIATLGVFSVAGALEETGSALAGKAVWGLKAGFSAMMGYGAYEGGKEKDKHPTTPPAAAPGSEDRSVEITLKNPSNQALSNLDIKCWLLVRDVKSRDITIGNADSNTITIPPRSQVVMTSSVAKCDFTPRATGAGKPVPAKGNKFYGYGVQVLEWGKIAAQTYDPPDVKTEIDAAAKKDK